MQRRTVRSWCWCAGLNKLCPQASLVVTSVGRSSAESLLTCTQRHRGSVALHERLLGPLGCVLGALGGSWTLLEASWAIWEASGEPLGRSWSHLRGILSALGASWDASWALLDLPGRRLGRSWSCLGGVLGVLGAVWEASWELLAVFCRLVEFHTISMNFMFFDVFLWFSSRGEAK